MNTKRFKTDIDPESVMVVPTDRRETREMMLRYFRSQDNAAYPICLAFDFADAAVLTAETRCSNGLKVEHARVEIGLDPETDVNDLVEALRRLADGIEQSANGVTREI